MIKVVIFDLDGTLLDTIDDLANACNYALNKYELDTYEVEKYKVFVGNGAYKLVKRALTHTHDNSEKFEKVFTAFKEYYNEHMIDMTKPYDGIIELLDEFKSKGLKLAVISNKPHEFTVEIVKKYFGDRFDIVFGHRKDYPTKPDPISLLEVIETFDVSKRECIYIGDSDVDMITAENAGVSSIGVLWGFRTEEELVGNGAEYIARTTDELKKIIVALK